MFYKHGMKGSSEYRAFYAARNRCNIRSDPGYKNYGGRGIKFKFKNFVEFFVELGKRPSQKHSLDRIDNDGHYEIGNVRWATISQQNTNRRNGKYYSQIMAMYAKGMRQCDIARKLGIYGSRVFNNLRKGGVI